MAVEPIPAVSPEQCQEMCRRAVAIWQETIGKAPEVAQASACPAGVSMIFRGVLTHEELALVRSEQEQEVKEGRHALFSRNRERLLQAVQPLVDRRIEDVLYQPAPQLDLSVFTFVFSRSIVAEFGSVWVDPNDVPDDADAEGRSGQA